MRRLSISRLALGLLLAGGCGNAARGAPGTAPDGGSPEDTVRVMTFNIRYGTATDGENAWPLRRSLVFDVIREFRPAVLGIQEALRFQLDEIGRALPGYGEAGVGRDDGATEGEYAAILFDSTHLALEEQGTFWFSDRPQEVGSVTWGNRIPRICTWVTLRDRETGRRFHVFNVHWDHESQESRERSARLLLDRIAARERAAPVIVTGDFNAGEDNAAFRLLVEDPRTSLRDTFRALYPAAAGAGTFNGFRGESGGEKIDAVLVSRGWEVLAADIVRDGRGGRYPSDHFPVTASLARGISLR